jgi:2-phospho-L-lactate guanylyltransferase
VTGSWVLLVPVKSTRVGKSRIQLPPDRRARLALAMALDTVTAVASAAGVDRVVVLVDDESDGTRLASVPAVTVHQASAQGLNAAIAEGLSLPAVAGHAVAVLPADLPSLRSAELDAALRAAGGVAFAVVADRQGTGTTLLAARDPALLRPHYGPGSFAAHVAAGAVPLVVPAESGLRRDVDVLDDLRGVTGPLTCAESGDLGTDTAAG